MINGRTTYCFRILSYYSHKPHLSGEASEEERETNKQERRAKAYKTGETSEKERCAKATGHRATSFRQSLQEQHLRSEEGGVNSRRT